MRICLVLCAALLLVGCQRFESVDDACKKNVPGDQHASRQGAIDAVARLNCYRRLARVGVLRFDKIVQEVTEDHVSYMAGLPDLSGYVPGQESMDQNGFTGANLDARLEAKNYQEVAGSLDRWEVTPVRWPFSGADNIDYLFPDPWIRQAYLQPLVIGAGFDERFSESEIDGGWLSYLTLLYDREQTLRSFVYPVDGQIDVDPSYTDEIMGGGLVEYGEVGYPITVFVNSDAPVLEDYLLRGPSGNVDVVIHLPGDASWGPVLSGTIAITPLEPLEPNQTYEFTARVRADGVQQKLESTFTTASKNSRPSFEFTTTTY